MDLEAIFKNQFGEQIFNNDQAKPYHLNCEGYEREIIFIYKPSDEKNIKPFINLCADHELAIHPISAGRNWGYGSSLPTRSQVILIDLSNLDKIVLDEDLGIVEIQPGVTPQKLYNFLLQNKSKWMTPVTGAGPHGSILGNALERGFGLNPIMDHFDSVLTVKAILYDGTIYESRLANIGATKSDQVSRWKVGPYMEGLFSQSNFGLIISIKIQLAQRPKTVDCIVIKGYRNQIPEGVKLCRDLHENFGGNLGGLNFSDRERIESTISSNSSQQNKRGIIKNIKRILGLQLLDFQIVVPVYTTSPTYNQISKAIFKHVKKQGFKTVLITEKQINFLSKIKPFLNFSFINDLWEQLDSLISLIKLLKGQPSNFTLKIAYTETPNKNQTNNPAKDQIGLLWFAPIIRLKEDDFTTVINIFETVLPRFNQKSRWTFTVLNHSLAEATIPIFFNIEDKNDHQNALNCWNTLFNECLKEGFAPYRYSIEHMHLCDYKDPKLKQLQMNIKKSFDPNCKMSPGRYTSL